MKGRPRAAPEVDAPREKANKVEQVPRQSAPNAEAGGEVKRRAGHQAPAIGAADGARTRRQRRTAAELQEVIVTSQQSRPQGGSEPEGAPASAEQGRAAPATAAPAAPAAGSSGIAPSLQPVQHGDAPHPAPAPGEASTPPPPGSVQRGPARRTAPPGDAPLHPRSVSEAAAERRRLEVLQAARSRFLRAILEQEPDAFATLEKDVAPRYRRLPQRFRWFTYRSLVRAGLRGTFDVTQLVRGAETQQRLRAEILQYYWRCWQYQGKSAEKCSELASKLGRELERWWTHHKELLAAVSKWQKRWRLMDAWCSGIALELVIDWSSYGEPLSRDAEEAGPGAALPDGQDLLARVGALCNSAMAAKLTDPASPPAGGRRRALALPGAPASDWGDQGPMDDPLFPPWEGWSPQQGEPRSWARRRLVRGLAGGRRLSAGERGDLEKRVGAYLDERESETRESGWRPHRARKAAAGDRWEWLAAFQVARTDMSEIADRSKVTLASVSEAVHSLAGSIGLTLRSQRHAAGSGRPETPFPERR